MEPAGERVRGDGQRRLSGQLRQRQGHLRPRCRERLAAHESFSRGHGKVRRPNCYQRRPCLGRDGLGKGFTRGAVGGLCGGGKNSFRWRAFPRRHRGEGTLIKMSDDSKNPLVTVVCSTYNSKATLRCALRSVLNQDLADFEVRVMGDACTDGTEEIVAELNDARLHWYNFPQNTGSQSEPNNEGLRRARGRYVAFI